MAQEKGQMDMSALCRIMVEEHVLNLNGAELFHQKKRKTKACIDHEMHGKAYLLERFVNRLKVTL